MKKTILVLATVALLAFAGSAWAQGVNFVRFTEGAAESDLVTIDWVLPTFIVTPGGLRFDSPNPRDKNIDTEFAEVIFYLQGALPLNNVGDTYTTLMVEPDGEDTPSDTAVLKLLEKDAALNVGIFDLIFQSDGSPGFLPVEPNRIVVEDGTSQEIMNFPSFAVLAKSDLDVPEPSTIVFTGTSLLLLGHWGRKRLFRGRQPVTGG